MIPERPLAILVPETFHPNLPRKHPYDSETFARREALKDAAYQAGGTEVKLNFDLLREARAWAKRVHGPKKVKALLRISRTLHEEEFVDPEKDGAMKIQRHSAIPALMAVATAISAAKILFENQKQPIAIAATFPPGHHAGRAMEGYCYFNNLVIALRYYEEKSFITETENVAILDLDAHVGNGTISLIKILLNYHYFSMNFGGIYKSRTAGSVSRQSYGERFHFVNLVPGISAPDYLRALETVLDQIGRLNPKILGISLGFDPDRQDPVTSYERRGKSISDLDASSYLKIGSLVQRKTSEWGTKVLVCFEGGYHPEAVFDDASAFLLGLKNRI